MKKVYLLFALVLGSIMTTTAQHHNVKLNVLGLAWGNVGLNYEYVVNDIFSIQASGALYVPREMSNLIKKNIQANNEDISFTKNKQMGYSVSLEGRIYTKQNAPNGFYLGPFVRYYDYWVDADLNYPTTTSTGQMTVNEVATFGFKTFSGGIQLGAQWLIKDKVSIDLSFAGMGVSSVQVYGSYKTDNPSFNSAASKEDMEEIPVIGKRMVFTDSPTGYDLKSRYLTMAWRSAFRVGYFF